MRIRILKAWGVLNACPVAIISSPIDSYKIKLQTTLFPGFCIFNIEVSLHYLLFSGSPLHLRKSSVQSFQIKLYNTHNTHSLKFWCQLKVSIYRLKDVSLFPVWDILTLHHLNLTGTSDWLLSDAGPCFFSPPSHHQTLIFLLKGSTLFCLLSSFFKIKNENCNGGWEFHP